MEIGRKKSNALVSLICNEPFPSINSEIGNMLCFLLMLEAETGHIWLVKI